MSELSIFFFLVSICYILIFWYYKLRYKWAFITASLLLLADPVVNYLSIPILKDELSLLGVLFFIIGFTLVILYHGTSTELNDTHDSTQNIDNLSS
ncbi:MAG: hypothetical protein ACFFB5_18680 [Promethearchaeota archaeon]